MRARRAAICWGVAAMLTLSLTATSPRVASAEEAPFDLPQVMADFWASESGKNVIAQYAVSPDVTDPEGDAEFSTGEPPGRDLPPGLDIIEVTWAQVQPPTAGPFFPPGSDNVCDLSPPGVTGICSESAGPAGYADGASIFSFRLGGPPDLLVDSGVCEYVIWIDDPTNPDTFTALDVFPNDPADGTNTAFGVRSGPDGAYPFRLDLTSDGFFADTPTSSAVFVQNDELAILIPAGEMSDPTGARGYSFCTDGNYSAADSVADTTDLFAPGTSQLGFVDAPPPTAPPTISSPTTTISSPTTTGTSPTTTGTSPTTTGSPQEGAGGGSPWPVALGSGIVFIGLGLWLMAGRKGCEDELAAWQKAQKECDDARSRAKAARKTVADAEARLDQAEEDLDDLCDEMPPVCWEGDPGDTWVEDPNVEGSRIDRFDLFVNRAWARTQWAKYRAGDMTAEQVEAAWEANPPAEFTDSLRTQLDTAKTKKAKLDTEIKRNELDLDQAQQDLNRAEGDERRACAAAEAAKRAYDACMAKPDPTPLPPEGGTPEPSPGEPGPATGVNPGDTANGCTNGDPEELRNIKTLRVNVPVRLEPRIAGGHAHDASEIADEIGSRLRQGEVVAQAIGRFFSFKDGAKLVHDFDLATAADLGLGGISEKTGIPIPTNPGSAAANVTETVIHAARAIITKVPDLQERRLPDVDLSATIKAVLITLTCAEVWECRNGERVMTGKRLTIERGRTASLGTKKWTGETWASAQEKLAGFARRRYQPQLRRALKSLADFQAQCAGK